MKSSALKTLMAMICGVVLVTLTVQPSSAYTIFKNTAGVPYKWNMTTLPNNTIYWTVDVAAPAIVRESMQKCTKEWNDTTDGVLKFAEGPGGMVVEWDATGVKIPDTLFLAYAYFSSTNQQDITSARIVINAKNYTWQRGGYTGVGPMLNGVREANLDSVLLHEIGHTLGLDHSDRNVSSIIGDVSASDLPTMNSVIYPGAETLHADDEAGARFIYLNETSPTAKAPLQVLASPLKGKAPLVVSFSQFGGDGSTTWNFGDGVNIKGGSAVRRFTVPGVYNVEVDCRGHKGTVTVEIEGKASKKLRRSRAK